METEELKILLALEPTWTVSLNGLEFQTIRASDISIDSNRIRLGKWHRRLDAIEWLRPNVVRIEASQRLRSKRDRFTLYPGERLPSTADLRRRRRLFQIQLGRALAEHFHNRSVQRQTLYGAYSRFIVGNRAVIAVDPDESSATVNAIVRAALLWSPLVGRRLSVVAPKGRTQTITSRLTVLTKLRRMFEWLEWDGERLSPLTATAAVETEVHEFVQPNVEQEVARILESVRFPLSPILNIQSCAMSLRFRGIEVAQVREGSTIFPLGEPLETVLTELDAVRRHGIAHPLARAHAERWLESNLVGEIDRLLPSIDPEHIYPQVPSFIGEERNIIDLLAATKDGRLVVMEIKVSADPELPLQALDYWIAVERHRKVGDFERKGYFKGVVLKDEPALLVLVAPLLAFHKTLKPVLSVFPKDVPMLQIGLNQTWKREIKVLRRQQLVS